MLIILKVIYKYNDIFQKRNHSCRIEIISAGKGDEITFVIDEIVRPRDKVYLFKDVIENTA